MKHQVAVTVFAWAVLLGILIFLRRPAEFDIALRKYHEFLRRLPRDGEYGQFKHPSVVTGYHSDDSGLLGWNTGKGSEIAVCINGTSNSILHVLLHEFAHTTVPEYEHSKDFWKSLERVKTLAEEMGLYERIDEKEKICGVHVRD